MSGVVTTAANQPVPSATVRAYRSGPPPPQLGQEVGSTTTDSLGRYSLRLMVGTYEIWAIVSGYTPSLATLSITPSSPSSVTQNITVANDATLTGAIRDGVGTPLSLEVQFTLFRTGAQAGGIGFSIDTSRAISASGSYSITVGAGSYYVVQFGQLSANGYVQRTERREKLTLAAGTNQFDPVLPTLSFSGGPCAAGQTSCLIAVTGAGFLPNLTVDLGLFAPGSTSGYNIANAVTDSSGRLSATFSFTRNTLLTSPSSYELTASQYKFDPGFVEKDARTQATYSVQ